MLKPEVLESIKNILTEQRNELLQKLKRDKNLDEVDHHGDEVDEIQGKQLADVEKHLHQQCQLKLDKVLSALARIETEQDKFGECEGCGEDISEKRLMFNPSFVLCISCAELAEMKR
mgnify:CR=1 FL=1